MSKEILMLKSKCASGKQCSEGRIYVIPDEISLNDAKALVRMKAAEWVPAEDEPESESEEDAEVTEGKTTKKGKK